MRYQRRGIGGKPRRAKQEMNEKTVVDGLKIGKVSSGA